ncbi:MAG: acetyl-CoA carboxylase biotin carboxyl carrier protein [bacterium]
MDSISQADVIQILKMVEASHMDELHLEMGDLKLTVKRSAGLSPSSVQTPVKNTEKLSATAPAAVEVAKKRETAPVDGPPMTGNREGLTAIRASMLGTFYRSPKPGDPPFVEVGQTVTAEDTVCIIEVMKLFSSIKAGLEGRIAEVCVQDGELVEFDQTLFWVEETDQGKVSGEVKSV